MTSIEEETDNENKTHCRHRRIYTHCYFSNSEHPGRDAAFLFLAIVDVSNYPPPFDDAYRDCHRVYHCKSDEKGTEAGPTVTSRNKVYNPGLRIFEILEGTGSGEVFGLLADTL
jgi:hypothetical protein